MAVAATSRLSTKERSTAAVQLLLTRMMDPGVPHKKVLSQMKATGDIVCVEHWALENFECDCGLLYELAYDFVR